MAPDGFGDFFLASAGAGGAFVGLLFIAVSLGPERTFGAPADADAPRQQLAEGTFLTLINGFVISSLALIPGFNAGWVALVLGVGAVLISIQLVWILSRFHRRLHQDQTSWGDLLRSASVSMIAILVSTFEALAGLQLIREPDDPNAWRNLALVIVGLYTLGMLRVWVLIGDPRRRWSGWLNPLQDPVTT